MIKCKKINIISLQDWDSLVEKTYGRPYSFQQQDGCQPRGVHNFEIPNKWGIEDYTNESLPEEINGEEMGVSFESWLKRDPLEWSGAKEDKGYLRMFWERNFYPSIDVIIEDLHKKRLIEEGEYAIEIDW